MKFTFLFLNVPFVFNDKTKRTQQGNLLAFSMSDVVSIDFWKSHHIRCGSEVDDGHDLVSKEELFVIVTKICTQKVKVRMRFSFESVTSYQGGERICKDGFDMV